MLVGLAWLTASGQSSSSGFSPTPEQLDMFRNLPADQQQALMQQFGGAGNLSGSFGTSGAQGLLGGGSRASQLGRDGQNDQNDQQHGIILSQDAQDAQSSVLKPEDWVIVEVDFHLAPRPLASPGSSQSLSSGAGGAGAGGTSAVANGTVTGAAPGTPPESRAQDSQNQNITHEEAHSHEQRTLITKLITLIRSRNPNQLSR